MAMWTKYDNHGYHISLYVNEDSYSVENNTSRVTYSFRLHTTNNYYSTSSTNSPWTLRIDGVVNTSGNIPHSVSKNSTYTLISDTVTVQHDDDGSKGFNCSAWITSKKSASYYPQSMSIANWYNLTKLPRYLSGVSVWVTSETETSVTWGWKANENVSNIGYYWDNGNWYYTEQNINKKNGNFTVSDIQPGSQHLINIGLQRKDSGLWSYCGNKSCSTYGYPYCSHGKDFNIGEPCVLTLFNPLKRNILVEMFGDDGNLISSFNTTSNSYTGFINETSKDNLLKSIPNKYTGHYTIKVTYEDHVNIRNADDYYHAVNYLTQYDSIEARDWNETTVLATKDDSSIVKGMSKVQINIINVKSAPYTILSKCVVSYNGETKEYLFENNTTSFDKVSLQFDNSSADEATIKFIDSRGLTKTTVYKIVFTEYTLPKLSIMAVRGDYDPVYNTWNDDESWGKWAKVLLNGYVDPRLEIDSNKSKIVLNSEEIYFSDFSNKYMGKNKLEPTYGYTINAILYDTLGRSVTASAIISSGQPIMSIINESGIAFGTIPEEKKFKIRNLQLDTIYNNVLQSLYNFIRANTIFIRHETRTFTQDSNKEEWWWFGTLKSEPNMSREAFVDIQNSNGKVHFTRNVYQDNGIKTYLYNWGNETSITVTVTCLYFNPNTMDSYNQYMAPVINSIEKMNNGENPE
ncbi:MAG: DUF859 family phage minor structural protein [Eggerthia catenaformis]|uniref:DUF859 family phage minor structural protein n=1 Tax=Eggerthia catenaformis TaxID=31973 RepID=UPI003FA0CBE4